MKKILPLFLISSLMMMLGIVEQVYGKEKKDTTANSDTIYYVDHVNGEDTNDGKSPANAWKTLEKVNSTTFSPGEQILFKADGEWVGQLHPNGSGAKGNPIIIGMYGEGEKPLIQGEGTVESVVYLYNQQYWEIGYLEITNYSPAPAQAPRRGVHVAAADVEVGDTDDLSKVSTLNHIRIHDLYIHDVNGEDKKDGDGSAGIQISVTIPDTNTNHGRTTFDDILIEDNVLDHVSRSGIITWNDWKSRDQLGYGGENTTPWTPLTNVTIRGNKLTDIGGDGIVPHMTESAMVEHNVVDGFNMTSTGYNVGMWTWNGDNTLYQYNEVSGGYSTRDGNAFDFDHGSRGIIYQYNYSHNNDGGTLLVCADGGSESGGVYDGIFRYNISQNDQYQTFTICGGNNVYNVQVYNNVFYTNPQINNNMLVSQGGNTDVTLLNNIFYHLGSGSYTKKASWTYDHNTFYGNNIPTKSTIPDANMMTTDPLFVNPGQGGVGLDTLDGYMLKDDSPAIGSGALITNNGLQDFWGNPLSLVNPNRGAFGNPTYVVSASDINILVDRFAQTDEFASEKAAHALRIHLAAVVHYEENGLTNKVVKHMESFKLLLDEQKNRKLLSKKAYNVLQAETDALIERFK